MKILASPEKKILDACCGSRMFWFQEHQENTLFTDIREEEFDIYDAHVSVQPDLISDFRDMPFEDESFYMVVFDPPHLKWAGPKSIMKAKYGELNKDWPDDLRNGFSECMRVLKENGTLIFKWSDSQVPVKEVLNCTEYKPLFGNRRGHTHWLVFMKGIS